MKSFTPFLFQKGKKKHENVWNWLVLYEILLCVDTQVTITHSCCACKSLYGAAYGNFYFLICSCYLGNRKSFFH